MMNTMPKERAENMTATNDLAEAVVIERTFNAPVERVWKRADRCRSNAAMVFRSEGIQAGGRF